MRSATASRRVFAAICGAILLVLVVAAESPQRDRPRTARAAAATVSKGLSFGADSEVVTIGRNGTARVIVSVGYHGGFTSTETRLGVAGLPDGVVARFVPHPLTHQGKAILLLEDDGRAPVGTYPLLVTAASRRAVKERPLLLHVTEEPGFELQVSPLMQPLARGGVARYPVSVQPRNGFDGPVDLVAEGLPAGLRASFRPDAVAPGAEAILSIRGDSVSSGRFPFEVVGRSGELSERADGTVVATGAAGSWNMSRIASIGAPINTILVGPGRGDGVNRVYAGTVSTGRVFEVSPTGSGWSDPVDIGGSPNGQEIHNMGMGPGRDDAVTRIYACSSGGDLIELTYRGPDWLQNLVGPRHERCYHALVGSGRNDGVNRVYAARGNAVWEYTHRQGAWSEVKLGEVEGVAHGIALGKARGKTTRVYVASTEGGTYEASFSSGSWRMVHLGDDGDTRNVSVGRGRRGGKARVYSATSRDASIREFTWRDGRWSWSNISEPVGSIAIHAWVANGRNDGVKRVYTATSDGSAFEFSWTGSRWRTNRMGRAQNYLYGLHFGRPGGGGIRLFGGSFDGNVYQFAWR